MSIAQIPSYVPTDSLMAWYGFNGNTIDETGNGYDGVNSGAILVDDRFGNTNSAYTFDGMDDYIEVSNIFDFEERTISCWFKPTSIIGSGASSRNFLTIDSDALQFGGVTFKVADSILYIYGGGEASPFQDSIEPNQWYHIVAVRSSAEVNYYYNGLHVGASSSGTIGSSNNPNPNLVIGSGRALTAQNFEGDVDDIGIWDRVLTPCEIEALYTGVVCGLGLNELNNDKELIKIVNLLGQETKPEPNKVLIYVYSDGTTEKTFIKE